MHSSQLEGTKYESDIGNFKILHLKSVFGQIGNKTKILTDLPENSHTRILKVLNTNPTEKFHDFLFKI